MIKFILMCFAISLNSFAIPISIVNTQDLNFGTLAQGDAPKVIRPLKSDSNNARFDVSGDSNSVYTIILPTAMSITRFGSGSFPLQVTNFDSRPAAGANGKLDKKGKDTIYVGATLEQIPVNQPGGGYSGSFIIDVIY